MGRDVVNFRQTAADFTMGNSKMGNCSRKFCIFERTLSDSVKLRGQLPPLSVSLPRRHCWTTNKSMRLAVDSIWLLSVPAAWTRLASRCCCCC